MIRQCNKNNSRANGAEQVLCLQRSPSQAGPCRCLIQNQHMEKKSQRRSTKSVILLRQQRRKSVLRATQSAGGGGLLETDFHLRDRRLCFVPKLNYIFLVTTPVLWTVISSVLFEYTRYILLGLNAAVHSTRSHIFDGPHLNCSKPDKRCGRSIFQLHMNASVETTETAEAASCVPVNPRLWVPNVLANANACGVCVCESMWISSEHLKGNALKVIDRLSFKNLTTVTEFFSACTTESHPHTHTHTHTHTGVNIKNRLPWRIKAQDEAIGFLGFHPRLPLLSCLCSSWHMRPVGLSSISCIFLNFFIFRTSPLTFRTKTVAGSCSTGPPWGTMGTRLDLITGNTEALREITSVCSTDRLHGEKQLLQRSQMLVLVMFVRQLLHRLPRGINDVCYLFCIRQRLRQAQRKTSTIGPDRSDIWQQNESLLLNWRLPVQRRGGKLREEKGRRGRRGCKQDGTAVRFILNLICTGKVAAYIS